MSGQSILWSLLLLFHYCYLVSSTQLAPTQDILFLVDGSNYVGAKKFYLNNYPNNKINMNEPAFYGVLDYVSLVFRSEISEKITTCGGK